MSQLIRVPPFMMQMLSCEENVVEYRYIENPRSPMCAALHVDEWDFLRHTEDTCYALANPKNNKGLLGLYIKLHCDKDIEEIPQNLLAKGNQLFSGISHAPFLLGTMLPAKIMG